MEPLKELSVEKWPFLQEKLKILWPLNIAGFYSIYLNLKYPAVREVFNFKVYCPFGDMKNGFVAINVKPNSSQYVVLCPVTEDITKLEQALICTKLIDWTHTVRVLCTSSGLFRVMDLVKKKHSFSIYNFLEAKTFFFGKKSKIFEDLRFPPNTHIAPVKEEHVQRINDVWPHKFPGSLQYFSILTLNGLPYGLYYNNSLVAWVFFSEYNFVNHLYCEVEHRRKGYAEFLLKYVINEELKAGNDIYAYVIVGNEQSTRLFEKLNFVDVGASAWILAKK